MRVEVEARVSGFIANYSAELQVEDLERFARELREMQDGLGRESTATLTSAQPDLLIELKMNRLGQISGRYAFESARRGGVPTVLSCAFDMDQSFLTSLQHGLATLVSAVQSL
jgi:hypothetical protein